MSVQRQKHEVQMEMWLPAYDVSVESSALSLAVRSDARGEIVKNNA